MIIDGVYNGGLRPLRCNEHGHALAVTGTLTPKGFQQLTSVSASTALTVPNGATSALIQAENQAIRWRDDGTAPTASIGMLLQSGATLQYNGDLTAIRLIETIASATINVAYYG